MNKATDFRIPRKIQVMCRPIDVVFERDLCDREDRRGEARYRRNQIAIQENTDSASMPFDHQVETYFHELIHWVFHVLEEHELNNNEALIEKMGKLFAQAALSAEYK